MNQLLQINLLAIERSTVVVILKVLKSMIDGQSEV